MAFLENRFVEELDTDKGDDVNSRVSPVDVQAGGGIATCPRS